MLLKTANERAVLKPWKEVEKEEAALLSVAIHDFITNTVAWSWSVRAIESRWIECEKLPWVLSGVLAVLLDLDILRKIFAMKGSGGRRIQCLLCKLQWLGAKWLTRILLILQCCKQLFVCRSRLFKRMKMLEAKMILFWQQLVGPVLRLTIWRVVSERSYRLVLSSLRNS